MAGPPKQARFWQHEDLPLFSGVAMRGQVQVFKPGPADEQATLPTACRACLDTGRIGNKFCWCAAGERAKKRDG